MRRLFAIFLLGMLMFSTGCVAVSAKNNRLACECQAVAVGTGDRIFIVNTKSGAVREVYVRDAEPFEPDEEMVAEDEE